MCENKPLKLLKGGRRRKRGKERIIEIGRI
jgi:hypothetical protein